MTRVASQRSVLGMWEWAQAYLEGLLMASVWAEATPIYLNKASKMSACFKRLKIKSLHRSFTTVREYCYFAFQR